MKRQGGSVLLLLSMLLLGTHVESHGDIVVSFCKNSKAGDWRKRLSHLLLEVPITVDEVYCPGVNGNLYAISVTHGLQRTEEVIKQTPTMSEEDYFKDVISKLTEDSIISVSESILVVLKNVNQAIVGFIADMDSKEQQVFQQTALAATLPKDMKVYQLTNKNYLPSHARSQVKGNLHVWVVTRGEWCHLALPMEQSFTSLFHSMSDPFNRLQYSSKFVYSSEKSYKEYKKRGFHLFIVYHRTNQLDTVHQTIIDPLVNVFRPYFAFVTFNADEHKPPNEIYSEGPFPYIVVLKNGERNGIHLDSQYIPYSFKTFSNIMEEMIAPKEDTPVPPGTIITHIDISVLQDLSQRDSTPAAAGLCQKGSVDCATMEEKMQKAVLALQKSKEEFEMTLYIAECESVADVSIIKVPKLPYIIAKETPTQWSLYSDTVKVTDFITVIQSYGSALDEPELENATADEGESSLAPGEYYDNFPELDEDDFVALSFPEYFSVPSTLPILTNKNYIEYTEQNENCLVAFYVPYSYSSKPMVYHILNTTEQLKKAGVSPSVINCAEYPDVCEVFDVYNFPAVKYRIGFNSEWITFKGVFSDHELVKLVDSSLKEAMETAAKENTLQELSPSVLLPLLKSDKGLATLLVLVTGEEIAPHLREALSSLKDHQVYWLNSTRYSKLSKFYVGSVLLEPPVLVWADYVKRSLHRLDIKKPVTRQKLERFIKDIRNGRAPDEEISENNWKPLSPAIVFPSAQSRDRDFKDEEDDYYGGSYRDEPRNYQYIEREDDEAHIPVSVYRKQQGMGEEGVTLDEEEQYSGYPSHRQEL